MSGFRFLRLSTRVSASDACRVSDAFWTFASRKGNDVHITGLVVIPEFETNEFGLSWFRLTLFRLLQKVSKGSFDIGLLCVALVQNHHRFGSMILIEVGVTATAVTVVAGRGDT
jgi:hypothetical protein